MGESKRRWGRWKSGTFRLTFKSGAHLVFTGGLRIARDDAGFIVDYDVDAPTVVLVPLFSELHAIELT